MSIIPNPTLLNGLLGVFFEPTAMNIHNTWSQYDPYIEWVLNNVRHESTLHSPSELFFDLTTPNPVSPLNNYPQNNIPDQYHKKLFLANEV